MLLCSFGYLNLYLSCCLSSACVSLMVSTERENSYFSNIIICLLDMMSQLELGKPEERRKPQRRVNGIFWIILLNLGIYAADHMFQVLIYSCYKYIKDVHWTTLNCSLRREEDIHS